MCNNRQTKLFIYCSEDSSQYVRNVGACLPICTESHLTRLLSSIEIIVPYLPICIQYINNQTTARNKFRIYEVKRELRAFCGTWMFSILFTKSCHWTSSRVKWSHFTPATSYLWPTFILLSHLSRGSQNRFSLPNFRAEYFYECSMHNIMHADKHSIAKQPGSFPQLFHTSANKIKLLKTYLHIITSELQRTTFFCNDSGYCHDTGVLISP